MCPEAVSAAGSHCCPPKLFGLLMSVKSLLKGAGGAQAMGARGSRGCSAGDGGLWQSCWQVSGQRSCPQPCHLPGQTRSTPTRSAVGQLRGLQWGREVRAAFRAAGRCLDLGWDTSLVPQILLSIPPSCFYLAFQGLRSRYSHRYQATLDLLRADKVCLASSLRYRQRWPVLMALYQLISCQLS